MSRRGVDHPAAVTTSNTKTIIQVATSGPSADPKLRKVIHFFGIYLNFLELYSIEF